MKDILPYIGLALIFVPFGLLLWSWGKQMERDINKLRNDEKIKELQLLIFKNLFALEQSEDKRQGLLPQVYYENKRLFEEVSGVNYSFVNLSNFLFDWRHQK
jgi:hypothetical protein